MKTSSLTTVILTRSSFRWVNCQLEALSEMNTISEIKEALNHVPKTLGETYQTILKAIPSHQAQLTKRCLLWLAFSLKPMHLPSLAEAVLISEEKAVINDDVRLLRPEILVKLCSRLINFDVLTTSVDLAHSSVYDFLTSEELASSENSYFYLDESECYTSLAKRCINYMMLPAFSSGACTDKVALLKRFEEWPLLLYIRDTLLLHIRYAKLNSQLVPVLFDFFASHKKGTTTISEAKAIGPGGGGGGGNFGAWVQTAFPHVSNNTESSTPLYYAARMGHLKLVKLILQVQGTRDIELRGGFHKSTPLHVAAYYGHTAVVAELLNQGADPHELNANNESGLMWAELQGFEDIQRMLRDRGAVWGVQGRRAPSGAAVARRGEMKKWKVDLESEPVD